MEAPPPPPPLRQLPRLPEDVIPEILSWLPVKPLVRFRCVSPSWRSIISAIITDPKFVKLHLERSPRNAYTVLTLKDKTEGNQKEIFAVPCSNRSLLNFPLSPVPVADSYPLEDEYLVLGSCNGLVCLYGPAPYFKEESEEMVADEAYFRFWNPATRVTSLKSPTLPGLDNSSFGFGYDESSDAYKVVAILDEVVQKPEGSLPELTGRYLVKVYTMGDNRWRDIESFPALPLPGNTRSENDGVYLSGMLIWFGLTDFDLDNYWDEVTLDRLLIVSLDLRSETYSQLSLPDGLDQLPKCRPVLCVLMDRLCISHDMGTRFVIWQMTEFGVSESWTQMVNVGYVHLRLYLPHPEAPPLVPVCMSDDGHFVVLASSTDRNVTRYNRQDRKVEVAAIPDNKAWTHPKDYIQSLVQPLPL